MTVMALIPANVSTLMTKRSSITSGAPMTTSAVTSIEMYLVRVAI